MSSLFSAASKTSKRKASSKDDIESEEARIAPPKRNKQRVLVVPSRGVTMRMRHLVNDIESLLPHSKKESKLDSKSNLHIINELAELNNCNNTLYFESRKAEDLYLWASKTPNGPSAKFHVQNIHTMDELKMTGNCLKGSRPVLSFDKAFEEEAHWKLLKEMLTQIFGVPPSSRRAKPFVDHVLSFSICDDKIWFRNYQILEKDPGASAIQNAVETVEEHEGRSGKGKGKSHSKKDDESLPPTLNEIGPRMVLTPIRIFEGSFGGATVFENPVYISPNAARHSTRRQKGDKYSQKQTQSDAFKLKQSKLEAGKTPNELSTSKVFA